MRGTLEETIRGFKAAGLMKVSALLSEFRVSECAASC